MSEINTYQKENPIFSFNGVDVDPTFFNNDVWLSRKDLQKLFRKSESSIRKALNEVEKVLQDKFSANSHLFDEMVQDSASGHYKVQKYNLQIIVRLGFRLNGLIAEAFQDWATSTLKREIQEQANPHLTLERGIDRLKDKGESDEKITNRVKGKLSRRSVTDEIADRDSAKNIGYHTNQGYYGMTGKDAKGLRESMGLGSKESILDNMTATQLAIDNVKNLLKVDLMRKRDAKGKKECGKCCYDAGKKVSALWEETLDLNAIE